MTKKKANLMPMSRKYWTGTSSDKMEKSPVSDSLVAAAKAMMRENKNINARILENDLESTKL